MTARRDSRSNYGSDPRREGALSGLQPDELHVAEQDAGEPARPANPFANPYAVEPAAAPASPAAPRVRRRDLRNREAGTARPAAPSAPRPSPPPPPPPPPVPPVLDRYPPEETQTFHRADVPAPEHQEREAERQRVDQELAAQKAALDATLRRPRDNRGNRKRRTPPATGALPSVGTPPAGSAFPRTAPRGIAVPPPVRLPAAAAAATSTPLFTPTRVPPASQASPSSAPAAPAPSAGVRPAPPQGMRTAAVTPSARNRRVGPILAMLLVVLIGFGLVVFGGLRATYLAPPTELTATLTNNSRVPVLATQIGMLGLEGPRTRVTVRSASSSSTVFLGIGRAADVDAYLGNVNRMDLVGVNQRDQLLTRLSGTQPTLPDPASTDVWVVSVRAKGAATLVWPQTEGQWRLIAATDGKVAAPASVEFSWSGRPTETLPPVLIAIGFVLMVAGGVSLVMISSRTGLDGAAPGGPGGTNGSTSAGPDRPGQQPTHFREGARL